MLDYNIFVITNHTTNWFSLLRLNMATNNTQSVSRVHHRYTNFLECTRVIINQSLIDPHSLIISCPYYFGTGFNFRVDDFVINISSGQIFVCWIWWMFEYEKLLNCWLGNLDFCLYPKQFIGQNQCSFLYILIICWCCASYEIINSLTQFLDNNVMFVHFQICRILLQWSFNQIIIIYSMPDSLS